MTLSEQLMHHFIAEIEEILNSYPKRTSKQNPESYIGGGQSKLRYLGLRVPHLHQALRVGFSFSTKRPEEIAAIWDYVWHNSDCYEVMSLALSWFYHPHQRTLLEGKWPKLKKWSGRIDNWAHADSLSGIYARILEANPKLVYPTLKTWSRSKNPWARRLSMVSLLYYSSQRKKVLPIKQILSLVEPQLDYEHYYVQKGVGWTLRETYNVYPQLTLAFIEKNIVKLSTHAFSAATEKIPQKQRENLKKLRKDGR